MKTLLHFSAEPNHRFIFDRTMGSTLEMLEADSSPDVTGIRKVVVPNGSLADNGNGQVTLTITASDITAADEGTDTTCFPVFVTAATGSLGPKTNAGLTFNSSTATLGATAFSGPLTGNVTGNCSGSSGSCTGNSATATSATTATTATSATTATNLAGGLGGQVPYQSAAGTTAMLANGNAGEFLKSNGTTLAPSWAAVGGGGDMVLASDQSVTGLKTFDKDKLAMKGTSTGVTTFSTANAGASDYTITYPAATGTVVLGGGTASGTNTGDQDLSGYVAKATYDAHTVLYATTDDTPAALVVGEQTVVGRATGGNISALAIDSDLSSVSSNDDTIPSAKATKAALDGKLSLAGGTMTGDMILGENTSVQLDPSLSADGKYSGITMTGTGGATIAFGDLVTLDKDDSRWEKVDISVAAAATGDARGLLGMAVTSSSDGAAITVLLQGNIRADANFPTLTIGAAVYASTTGDVTSTQPSTTDHVIRIIGHALTADSLYFAPDGHWISHI